MNIIEDVNKDISSLTNNQYMNPKDVKFLHFTNEEEKEYKQAKHMLRNAIITLLIIISLIIVVLVSGNNTELTTLQVRCKSVFYVLAQWG